MKKYKFIVYLFVMVFMVSSCEKEKSGDESSPFVGNWTAEMTFMEQNVDVDLDLTEDSFNLKATAEFQEVIRLTVLEINGSLTSEENTLSLLVKNLGFIDPQTNTFKWYSSEDSEFAEFIDLYASSEIKAEYEMVGEEMNLKLDLNSDGEYSENEIAKFSKK